MAATEINVGLLPAYSPALDPARLQELARWVGDAAAAELERATDARWRFHVEEPVQLGSDDARRPSDFLDEASLRMAEGPFDIVVVLTDAPLVSRRRRVMPGLASPIARIAVISTRKLLTTPRGRPVRSLEDPPVRGNAATLLLHLIGHLLGLDHTRDAADAMAPFHFDEERVEPLGFGPHARGRIARASPHAREYEYPRRSALGGLLFHVRAAFRHLPSVLRPLLRNRAPLLPLGLPSLATAAVVPTLILIFTAEIWDVGLNLGANVVWISTVVSILAATWYLSTVQDLYFPRKEKRVIPEHMAVVNVTIFLTMLLALVGLFTMVGLLMLVIELLVFPPGLIRTWPTLGDPEVTLGDKIIMASFISVIGTITGALAGGLESRTVIRHLALFLDEP